LVLAAIEPFKVCLSTIRKLKCQQFKARRVPGWPRLVRLSVKANAARFCTHTFNAMHDLSCQSQNNCIVNGQVIEMQAIWDLPELMMQAHTWPLAPQLDGLVGLKSHWIAEGDYVCETGWPNMRMTLSDDS